MAVIESKQVLGRSVIGIAEGERLGKVKDVLVDAPARRVVGFLVEPARDERDAQILRSEDVRAIGDDAVTVESRACLRPLAVQGDIKGLLEQQMPIRGKTVISEEGNRLGHVDEFTFDPQQFAVGTYIVLPSGIGGLFLGGATRRVSAESVVSAGPDAVVVRLGQEEVAPQPGLG